MPYDEPVDEGLLVTAFLLGEAAFGVDARLVQEVVKVGDITPVHDAPAGIVGIRNLRGRIVTVIDLAAWLGLGSVLLNPDSRLMIMEWQGEPIGFLVDAVTDALMMRETRIAVPPASLDVTLRRHLRGVWREADRIIAILDPQALFQWEEPAEIGGTTAERRVVFH